MTRIEDNTFRGCAALRAVLIPDSITYVADTAFSGCSAHDLHCELRCPSNESVLNIHNREKSQNKVLGPTGCTTAILGNLTCGIPENKPRSGSPDILGVVIAGAIGAGAVALCLGAVVLRGRRLERRIADGTYEGLLPRNSNMWRRVNSQHLWRHNEASLHNYQRSSAGFMSHASSFVILVAFAALPTVIAVPLETDNLALSISCINITAPSLDFRANSRRIQAALNDSRGCVTISGGDYPVLSLKIGSNTHLSIAPDTRLVNVINHTRTAVVHILDAKNVTIDGGGTIYGNAEHAWRYWSTIDDRMSPYFDDGLPLRSNTLLVENSDWVVVRDVHLHNSTDWTFSYAKQLQHFR